MWYAGRWVTWAELRQYDLRGEEPHEWFRYVEQGGSIHPLGLLSGEADPVIDPRDEPDPRQPLPSAAKSTDTQASTSFGGLLKGFLQRS